MFTKWAIDTNKNIVVDEYNQPYSFMNIQNGDCVKLIIEISDLWINNNQFGTFVMVQKIRVRPFQVKVENEYIFDDSKSESSEEETDKVNDKVGRIKSENIYNQIITAAYKHDDLLILKESKIKI